MARAKSARLDLAFGCVFAEADLNVLTSANCVRVAISERLENLLPNVLVKSQAVQ